MRLDQTTACLLHLLACACALGGLSCAERASDDPRLVDDDVFEGEGGGRWEEVAPIASGARQEVSVLRLGDEVAVLGGFNESVQVVSSLDFYSPTTDAWRAASPAPERIHHANAAVVDGKLYVVGFLTGRGFTPDGRTFIYEPATDTWRSGQPMPAGTERGASAVAVVEGRIVVAGGLRGDAVSDVSTYDPVADAWTENAPMPDGVDHATAQPFQGLVYVFGGRFRSIGSHTARVQIYDPAADTWRDGQPMPTSRAGLASAVLGELVYVFGGEGNADHPSGVFNDSEVYDPVSDSWTLVRPMRTRRHGTGAASLDGAIYIPGGAAVEAFGALHLHERYLP